MLAGWTAQQQSWGPYRSLKAAKAAGVLHSVPKRQQLSHRLQQQRLQPMLRHRSPRGWQRPALSIKVSTIESVSDLPGTCPCMATLIGLCCYMLQRRNGPRCLGPGNKQATKHQQEPALR